MFSRDYRLTKKDDFDLLFKTGAYASFPYCTIRWRKNALEHSRFGFIVANTISKKATVRNTIKRRLRECVRKNSTLFPPLTDMVFIAKRKLLDTTYKDIEAEVLTYPARMCAPRYTPQQRVPVNKKR